MSPAILRPTPLPMVLGPGARKNASAFETLQTTTAAAARSKARALEHRSCRGLLLLLLLDMRAMLPMGSACLLLAAVACRWLAAAAAAIENHDCAARCACVKPIGCGLAG